MAVKRDQSDVETPAQYFFLETCSTFHANRREAYLRREPASRRQHELCSQRCALLIIEFECSQILMTVNCI